MDSAPTGQVVANGEPLDGPAVDGALSIKSDSSRRSSIQIDDTQDIIREDGFPHALNGQENGSMENGLEFVAPTFSMSMMSAAPMMQMSAAPMMQMSAEEGGNSLPKKQKKLPEPAPPPSDTLALVPLHKSKLVSSVQIARLRLADYDPTTTASMRSLTRRDLDQFTDELRLRVMARKGTRVDEIFKRGEEFIDGWFTFVPILAIWEPTAQDCSDVLMTFCKILLKQTVRGSTLLFEKILATLRHVGVVLLEEIATTKKENLTAPQVTEIVTDMIVLLLGLCAALLRVLKLPGSGSEALSFLTNTLSTFMIQWTILRNNFKLEIWQLEVGRGGGGQGTIGIETLRAWLLSQQVSARPGLQQPTSSPFEDIPLEWLRSLIAKFTRSDDYMLVMTGESGIGKSGLMPSIVDFLRLSTTTSTPVLTFHIEPSSRSERSELNLVKFLLLQLFDRLIGNLTFYERLCAAYIQVERDKIANPEVLLWGLFSEQLSNQSGDVYILVDGLDKIEGQVSTATKVRGILYDICARAHRLKTIILSQPIFLDYPPGCQHFRIEQQTILTDLHLYLERRIRNSSKLQFLTRREIDEIVKRFVNRTLTTFLEVTLFVGWLELHRSFEDIQHSLRDIPKTLDELIDHLILRIDFHNQQTQALLSWMLVAEKPLSAHELMILLGPAVPLPPEFAEKEALYLQSLCPTLLEVRGQNLRFKHIKIKERMLELALKWKITMHLNNAHATALVACVAYIRQQLGRGTDLDPAWDVSEEDFNKKLREAFKKDSVLEYSIRYYIIHFERSELGAEQLTKRLGGYFFDSVELATYERFCWGSLAHGAALESLHKHALRLRITLLGKFSRSSVQTLISLAQYQIDAGSDDMALTYVGVAWDVAQNLGTTLETICYVLADKYLGIYQALVVNDQDAISIGIIENVLQYLWSADEIKHGPDSSITLGRAEMLKAIYSKQGKYQQVVTILQRLYDTFAKKRGQFDERAIKYAVELIRWLTKLGQYGKVKQLCEDILLSMSNVIARSDERRIKIVLILVEYYEVSGQRSMAIDLLRKEWDALLAEATGKPATNIVLVALLRIAVRLCINTTLTKAYEVTDEIVKKTWVVTESRLTESVEIMRQSRILAQACIRSDRPKTALLILEKLSLFYMQDVTNHFEEAVEVALALVLCYQKLGKSASEVEHVYRRLFDLFITLKRRESACITLAMELINYYQTMKRVMDAMEIGQKTLQLFWREILTIDSGEAYLPQSDRTQTLDLGFRYADLTSTLGNTSQAVAIYQFIWRSCQKSLQITDIDLFKAAKKLSVSFEKVDMKREAVDLWRAFRTLCIAQLGAGHSLVRRVTEELVSLYVKYDFAESEQVLLEIIRVGGESHEMYCRQPTLNAILNLLKLYERKQQLEGLRIWYTELWTALKYYRQAANVDGSIIFDVVIGYRRYLALVNEQATIIQVARELRAICQTDYGHLSLYYMKATFDLAVLLENDKILYREAVTLFEELIGMRFDSSDDKIEMLKLAQDARLRLALLYARYAEYANKAEGIMIKAWRIALRTNGATDDRTKGCFSELIKFYRGLEKTEATKAALALLDEYIVAILIEEKEEKKLFDMAGYISTFYINLKSTTVCTSIMDDIRGEYLGLGGDIVRKYRFGSSGSASLDRRCFVFILAIEQIIQGRGSQTLFSEIIESLFTEVALYEGWAKISRSSQSLQARLIAGIRLLKFLESKNRALEARTLRWELWKLYQSSLGSLVEKPGTVRQLFDVLVSELEQRYVSITVVQALGEACMELWLASAFDGCLDILRWIHSCYMSYTKLSRQELIRIGFRLSGIISGTGEKPNPGLLVIQEIRKLVFEIIQVMFPLDEQDGVGLNFDELKPSEINILIEVFVALGNMDALEKFFQALWDSRTMRDWSPKITIGLGKRLCWAKYENKHKEAALELIEDMCYNLQDTYGDADPWTIDCRNLQGQLMGSSGSYESAMLMIGKTLEDLLKSTEEGGPVSKTVAQNMIQQVRQLKAVYYLSGKWESRGQEHYQAITNQAVKRLATTEYKQEAAELADVSKWSFASKKGDGVNLLAKTNGTAVNKELGDAQSLAHWTSPADWKLDENLMVDAVYVNGTGG